MAFLNFLKNAVSGITVKPLKGNALYWFNHDHLGENDSRSYHLGCPVGVGNKWIANKWIKWTGQVQSQNGHVINAK